jgi:hypothetical protein
MVRKREDTAEGCRSLALDDKARAADVGSDHMRTRLEHSADAWTARAKLLERLETNFNARAEAEAEALEERRRLERNGDG